MRNQYFSLGSFDAANPDARFEFIQNIIVSPPMSISISKLGNLYCIHTL